MSISEQEFMDGMRDLERQIDKLRDQIHEKPQGTVSYVDMKLSARVSVLEGQLHKAVTLLGTQQKMIEKLHGYIDDMVALA